MWGLGLFFERGVQHLRYTSGTNGLKPYGIKTSARFGLKKTVSNLLPKSSHTVFTCERFAC